MRQILLQNETLSVVILPEMGGKIISFYHKQGNFELAAQNEQNGTVEVPGEDAAFGRYAFGMDDAFPNIDEEIVTWNNKVLYYPDHGEIWKQQFEAEQIREQEAILYWRSKRFAYEYKKHFYMKDNCLRIQYTIMNHGAEFPCIWTWHGLLRYEEDMRFTYPAGIRNMRNVLESEEIGKCGDRLPLKNDKYDFSKVSDMGTGSMVKYYGEECAEEGYCGVVYPTQGMKCEYHYDCKKLPYLGIWITAGGFDGAYNFALEPSTGFYDSIGTAGKEKRLPVLGSKEALHFEINIELDML